MVGVVLVTVSLLAVACGGGDGGAASNDASGDSSDHAAGGHAHEDTKAQFEESDADAVVTVEADDFVFRGIPPSVRGQNVFFRVTNVGNAEHELKVVAPDGEPVAEMGAFGKGKTKTLAVKLQPGTYVLQCLVEEGNATHADLGMKSTLAVT